MTSAKRTLAIVFTAALLLAACSVGSAGEDRGIVIEDAWARSDHADQNSAAYMVITNYGETDDTLVGARSDIAVTVEIHEVTSSGGHMMRMQQVESISVPTGGQVALKPGGLHVMLFGLHDDLNHGDEFSLTLVFESAGEYVVTVEVRDAQSGHGS